MTKDFQEELGEDFDTEFNEAFSSATKTATDKSLKGTVAREQEFMEVKLENGQAGYKCYVVVAVDLNMLTQSFEDELKNKNKKLYERFRASEAFNELDYDNKNSSQNDLDNAPMKHNEKSVQRFKLIPKGKNIVDVMDKVPKNLKISKFYSRGCTMRLDDNSPAPTLVPGHSNFPVHPYEHRSISVREAAQITGFPSNYKFFGNHTKRCEQVGNAVPILLAHALANQCKKFCK